MSKLTYCTVWSEFFKEPAEILTPAEARNLHEEKKPYSVLIEDDTGSIVVEMCFFQIYCHVLFLDNLLRVATRYSFVEKAERLFLEEAAVYYYADSGNYATRYELTVFKEDGSVVLDNQEAAGPIVRKNGSADVSRNYSEMPTFGQYDSVTVWDR